MLGPSHPLRQVSEDVLQELDPARGDRPFEWRRDFQIVPDGRYCVPASERDN